MAQPPLFKINRGNKSIYIKDEKELDQFILNNSSSKSKKNKLSTKETHKIIEEERNKLSIQRFKGLGEMNPEELWETTLNPDNRNLLKVQYSNGTKKSLRKTKNYLNFNGR